ncbi:MAG: TetR/AcrR family transcriptional regulator [Aeromicrobium sp.]
MASVRNTGHADRFLDAARDVILTVGWKRATLTDVARRAEVSRTTVYRSYPDMQTILADLMTREWIGLIDQVADDVADEGQSLPDLIALRVSRSVAGLRESPLFRRISEVDPEQLVPYLIDRRGRTQDAIVEVMAGRIAEAQAADEVRQGRPVVLARTLVLALHGFALSIQTMVDDEVSQADIDAELTAMVKRYLAP